MATENTYKTGDYVVFDHYSVDDANASTVHTVGKVNRTSIDVTPVSAGYPCRTPTYAVRPATEAERTTALDAARTAPPVYPGSVVTLHGKNGRYVIIAVPRGKSAQFHVVPLGGSTNGRYIFADRPDLDVVPLDS